MLLPGGLLPAVLLRAGELAASATDSYSLITKHQVQETKNSSAKASVIVLHASEQPIAFADESDSTKAAGCSAACNTITLVVSELFFFTLR